MKPIVAHLDQGWKRHADPGWLEGWEPIDFDLGDGFTQVVALGEGPPLLLIPPLPGYKEAWVACARPLSRSFRVVTFDLRARFGSRPRWEALLDDLDRVAAAFAPGAVGLVGHSLGGALAQRWVLSRPARVAALVLSSSFAKLTTPRGHWFSRYVEQPWVLAGQRLLPEPLARPLARGLAAREAWVYDRRCDDRILEFVRFCIRDVPVPVARAALRLAWEHDARADLPRLACPTLVVVGERESAFALQAAAELQRSIPGAALEVSPGVGHLHPFSGANWLVETIHRWLGPRIAP